MAEYIKPIEKIVGVVIEIEKNELKNFQRVIEALNSVCDSCTIELNEDNIRSRIMDASQVLMIDIYLPTTKYTKYVIEKPLKYGVDIIGLNKILKRIKADETLTIKIDTKIQLFVKGKTTREFTLSLLDAGDMPREPKIEYPCIIKANFSYNDILKDIELISDKATIKITPTQTLFESYGDTSTASIEIPETMLLNKETKEDADSTYSMEYLKKCFTDEKNTITTIKIKTDAPLCVEYFIGENIEVTYYLAPRIEST